MTTMKYSEGEFAVTVTNLQMGKWPGACTFDFLILKIRALDAQQSRETTFRLADVLSEIRQSTTSWALAQGKQQEESGSARPVNL